MAAEPVLATEDLSFAVGGVAIVSGVDLAVREGELLGVIGPNGAGKTSLLNLLSGLLAPTAGRVRMLGRDISRWPVHRRARAGLGRTFQSSSVFGALTVAENVRVAAQAQAGGSMRLWRRPAMPRRAQEALALVGLERRAGELAAALAHGEKRKLELAILLAGEPRVILLDEPMAGVSAEDVPELTELIARVRRERGATVVMVEHHMDVVLGLANRVAVMHHGALLVCDEPQTVMADPTVQGAYLGEEL